MAAWFNIWAAVKDVVLKLYLVAARLHWSFWFDNIIFIELQQGMTAWLNIWAAWKDYGLTRFLVAAGWHRYYWYDNTIFIELQKGMSVWLNIGATRGECGYTLYLVAAGRHWSNWFDIFIESRKGWQPGWKSEQPGKIVGLYCIWWQLGYTGRIDLIVLNLFIYRKQVVAWLNIWAAWDDCCLQSTLYLVVARGHWSHSFGRFCWYGIVCAVMAGGDN